MQKYCINCNHINRSDPDVEKSTCLIQISPVTGKIITDVFQELCSIKNSNFQCSDYSQNFDKEDKEMEIFYNIGEEFGEL